MDWQTWSTLAIALLCGGWLLWRWLRIFLGKAANGCERCRSCGMPKKQIDLVQIAPPKPAVEE